MGTGPGHLMRESASKIGGEVSELLVVRWGVGGEAASAIGTFVSSTIELLVAASGGGEVAARRVAIPLIEKNMKLAALTQPEAAACAVALYDLFVGDGVLKLDMARAGVAGAATYGAFLVYDVLKVYGECYIPLDTKRRVEAAEREAFRAFLRASGRNACAERPAALR